MSRKHHRNKYNDYYTMPNFFALLMLVLIVLQWFKVGFQPCAEVGPAEPNLVTNGGLFIIVFFLLAACSCSFESAAIQHEKHFHRKCRYH